MENLNTTLNDDLFQKNFSSEETKNLLKDKNIPSRFLEEKVKQSLTSLSLERYQVQLKDREDKLKFQEEKLEEELVSINLDGELKTIRTLKKIANWALWLDLIISIYLIFDYFFIKLIHDLSSFIFDSFWGPYIVFGLTAILIVLKVVFTNIFQKKVRRNNERKEKAREQYGISGIKESIEEIYKEINDSYSQDFKKALNKRINEYRNSLLGDEIINILPINLSETQYTSDRVSTNDFERINDLINKMPGGCIGLSGKRGIGKTTMLLMLEEELSKRSGKKPLLYLYTSAPINYTIRDFILFLFHSIGVKYLKENNVVDHYEEMKETEVKKKEIVEYIKDSSSLLTFFISLVIGLLFIVLSINMPRIDKDGNLKHSINIDSLTIVNQQSINNIDSTYQNDSIPNGSLDYQNPVYNADLTFINMYKIGLTPRLLFPIGILSILISVILFYFWNKKRNEKKKLHKEEKENWYHEERGSFIQYEKESESSNTSTNKLIKKWLTSIKFQQSFSSGWSGGLSLPIGLSGNIEYARQISHNQLSLPEIIDGFRKVVAELSKSYQIVICIDELDKQENNHSDKNFMNDIKAIFGIEGCFFLISVSEDAVSSFERRGIPIRDVFDSSFDDIIHLDFIDFDSAKNILEQKIIGFPELFVLLAHSISAGVPRELIRTTRKILELIDKEESNNSLKEISKILVDQELKSRINAFNISMSQIDEPELTYEAYSILNNLKGKSMIQINDLCAAIKKIISLVHYGVQRNEVQSQFHKQIIEIYSYFLYMAVMYYFFTRKRFTSNTRATYIERIEGLIKAKQLMQYNPILSLSILNDFIKKNNIKPLL